MQTDIPVSAFHHGVDWMEAVLFEKITKTTRTMLVLHSRA